MLPLALFICYLLGAIPFGVIAGKLCGVDVRAVGSGNVGATNVWRALGPRWGTIVFILDVAKGLAAPFIGRALLGHDEYIGIALCGVIAVLGHMFSVFLKFRGGKGIATSLGVIFGLAPLAAVIGFAVWGAVLLVTRMISVASIIACLIIPFAALLTGAQYPYVAIITIMALVAILKHIPNIKRIIAGTEPKIGSGQERSSSTTSTATVRE